MKKYVVMTFLTIALSGCIHPYTPEIQQGNALTEQEKNQIKVGMSKEQIQYILGTPVLENSLANNRWDYVYTLKSNTTKFHGKRLTLFFINNRLVKIEDAELTARK